MHCCCVIVKIAAVAPTGRLQISTTASSVKDFPSVGNINNNAATISGADTIASSASSTTTTTTARKPVCICNAQCRLQALKNESLDSYLKKHGSLDNLLQSADYQKLQQQQQQQQQPHQQKATPTVKPEQGYRFEKSYHQINGDIFEVTRKIPITSIDDHAVEQAHKLSRKKSLPKQYSQPQIPLRKSTTTDIEKKSSSSRYSEKPQPPPRVSSSSSRHKSADNAIVVDQPSTAMHRQTSDGHQSLSLKQRQLLQQQLAQQLQQPLPQQQQQQQHSKDELTDECFDRAQRSRHSSRSIGAAASTDRNIEWIQKEGVFHQRHSSGPSDLTHDKSDISEWLLKLPHKRAPGTIVDPKHLTTSNLNTSNAQQLPQQKSNEVQLSKSLREELTMLLKRPLQRQHSGPSELSVLRNDIVDWIRSQNFSKVLPSLGKDRQSSSAAADTQPTIPKPRKRHSLGHSDTVPEKIPEWIQYPLNRLSPAGRQKLGIAPSSCLDLVNKVHLEKTGSISVEQQHRSHPRPERRIRHSASEVVTPIVDKAVQPPKPDRMLKPMPGQSMPKDKYQYIYQQLSNVDASAATMSSGNVVHGTTTTTTTEKSHHGHKRSRRHQTQRSATVTDMTTDKNGKLHSTAAASSSRKSLSAERVQRRSSSTSRPPQCTDPMCPLMPICTDPNCCTYDCYNTSRSLPRYNDGRCSAHCYEYRCNSLPRCMDSKCLCKPARHSVNIVKHNSLPRCVSTSHRSTSQPDNLERSDYNRSSLPRTTNNRSCNINNNNHSNNNSKSKSHTSAGSTTAAINGNKLIKSASAVSLNSRRRRHKTVHFGENLLREVCQNRKLIEPLQQKVMPTAASSASTVVAEIGGGGASGEYMPLNSNIQMLYNFVEGVLSAWVDDDDEMKSGAESEPERGGGALVKPIHRCNRLRLQTIRRVVSEAAQLRGTLKLGNSRYRHRHWRGTAKECNERFLKKVSF